MLQFNYFIFCMVKIISLNVRGLSNFKKRRTIFAWCRKMKTDVIFLQETHSKIETENQWEREWGGKILFSHGSSNARGVVILFRNEFDISIDSSKTDQKGRFLVVQGNVEDNMFILANIYAPNRDRCSRLFFDNLQNHLVEFGISAEDNIIIGGDFNCPLNPHLDKKGGIMIPRANVVSAINELQTNDIWRIKNPDVRSFT